MTKRLDDAITRIRQLPPERQDVAAELLMSLVEQAPDRPGLMTEQEAAIECLVEAGLLASRQDALAYGLRRLTEDAHKLASLRADIQIGLAEAERGEAREITAEDIMRRVRERLEQERSPTPTR